MKERIDIATKIKERVLIRNLTLYSLEKLPSDIYKNIERLKTNFLLLYNQKFYKPHLVILTPRKILIKKDSEIPSLQKGELALLILPFSNTRYVFQIKITEENEEGFIGEIIDPRYGERITIKLQVPTFFSFITPKFVQNLLTQPGYQLLRESNFLPESYPTLKEIHLYDLIIDERHNIEDEFKSLIQKTFLVGELVDLSMEGLCAKAKGEIKISDDLGVFYIKFNLPLPEKMVKFALFTHLRNLTFREGYTYFHLTFLVSLRKEFWEALRADLLRSAT